METLIFKDTYFSGYFFTEKGTEAKQIKDGRWELTLNGVFAGYNSHDLMLKLIEKGTVIEKPKENLYTPDCIRTVSGKYVNVFEPDPATLCIDDIAHALSQQPRFGGHLPVPYSVAQHCCTVSDYLSPQHAFDGLMHDASEAYLLDIPSPIKARLANYKEIEDGLMQVLAAKFRFNWPVADEVKAADKKALEAEWDTIMLSEASILCGVWGRHQAKNEFLLRFKNLQCK